MPIHQCLYSNSPKIKKGKSNSIINSNIFNPDVKKNINVKILSKLKLCHYRSKKWVISLRQQDLMDILYWTIICKLCGLYKSFWGQPIHESFDKEETYQNSSPNFDEHTKSTTNIDANKTTSSMVSWRRQNWNSCTTSIRRYWAIGRGTRNYLL